MERIPRSTHGARTPLTPSQVRVAHLPHGARTPLTPSQVLLLLLAVVLAACSGPDRFKITGEIAGKPNTNLYIRYYGNGAVMTGVTVAHDGVFEAQFSSADPTLVEILDNDRHVIGRVYVRNGDEVHVTLDRANAANMQTDAKRGINLDWTQVLNDNAEVLGGTNRNAINEVVEGYIADHPDNPVASLLYATYYDLSIDPVRADSVMGCIGEQGYLATVLFPVASRLARYAHRDAYDSVAPIKYRRPRSDSTYVFDPRDKRVSLIVVSNENSRRVDSVVPFVKEIYKENRKGDFQLIDFVLYPDSMQMRSAVRIDSADWVQAWVPGSIFAPGLDELAIPAIPYYIVTDSGRQVYRGPSHAAARQTIKDLTAK